MKLEIKKIRLNELKEFVESRSFENLQYVPISPSRVESYLANPNADPEDVALYLGYLDERLVAFRSLFAGKVCSGDRDVKFGWCSGNWVRSRYRRLGISEQLLKEAYNDWDKKLAFTNYAPNSENLYLKTELFQPIHQFQGIRGYLYPKTRKLIKRSNRSVFSRTMFSIIDCFIVVFSWLKLLFLWGRFNSKCKFELSEFPDDECFEQLKKSAKECIFGRGVEELKWIFKYPWISEKNVDVHERYPFSAFSSSFKYQTVKIYKGGSFAGFFIFSVNDGHLKTLYFCVKDNFVKEIASFLKKYCKNRHIEVVTVYKKELAAELFRRKFPFLYLKKYGQKIYSTFTIQADNNAEFHDGEGDVMFT